MNRHRILRSFVAPLALAAALPISAFAAAPASSALALVPNDAVTVGMIRFSDLRSGALSSVLLQNTDNITADGDAQKFLTDAGLQPMKDIDTLVVATSPRTALGSDAEILIIAEGRYNVDRLTNALVSRGAVAKKATGGSYFTIPEAKHDGETGAVAFPDGHLAILGSEAAVVEALGSRASGGTTFRGASALGRDLARIDAHATAWAVVDVPRASRLTGGAHIAGGSKSTQAAAVSSAMKNVSTVAMWAIDAGDSLKLGAFGLTHDADTQQLLEDTLRGALSAMRLAAQEKSPDLVSVLRHFTVTHSDDGVSISGSVPAETLKTFAAKAHASR